MYASVISRIIQAGMAIETLVLRVLENEYAAIIQHIALQNHIHHLPAALQVVRGVREDHIITFRTIFQIQENICLHRMHGIEAVFTRRRTYEVVMYGVYLYRCDRGGAARGELVAYGAGARKEVEDIQSLEIKHIAQDVEQIFLGEICRRTGPQVFGRDDHTSAACAAYYSHILLLHYRSGSPHSMRTNHTCLPPYA